MTEDKFEEFLKKTAQSYNAPPARVPRDEMWAAIQAKRSVGPRVVYGGGATYVVGQRRFGTKVWLGAAAAAMLLVATGVGIGRWSASPSTPNVASSNLPVPGVVVPNPDAGTPGSVTPAATVPQSGGGTSRGSVDRTFSTKAPAVASNNTQQRRPELPNTNLSATGPSSAYQLTAVQHLSEAEALLTSFRARSTADQQMDAQLGVWARQLLSNTRLLLDSPVANDPQRRPLLEDLELVLVQIVQLSPGSTSQDRDLIEKTLQQDHVMTRLRTAIPAGSQRGG